MSTALREAIVAEARSWMNTPWSHQQRQKGVGVDCAGLIIKPLHTLNLSSFDIRDYERLPNGTMYGICCREMTRIPVSTVRLADALLMQWDRGPSHLGLVGDYPHGDGQLSIIHASNAFRKVCEHRLTPDWRRRIVAAFRLPGVED